MVIFDISRFYGKELGVYYKSMSKGWAKETPHFTYDFETKKSWAVSDARNALDCINLTNNPEEHTDLILQYIKLIVRIQKSEQWVAKFDAEANVKHPKNVELHLSQRSLPQVLFLTKR